MKRIFILLILPYFGVSQTVTITQAGTYTNQRYVSTNGSPAVQVSTNGNDTVKFINCYFESNGDDVVNASGYQNLVFRYDSLIAKVNINGNHQAKLIHTFKPRCFIMEHCYTENGYPVLLQADDETAANSHTFIVRYNVFNNVNKSKPDGSGDPSDHAHAVIFDGLQNVTHGEIAWNQCINVPGKSWVEDIINIHSSTGTAATPIWIHNNFLKGAYPLNLMANSYTGSGITTEESSKYVLAEQNQVLSTMNGGMNITGSDFITYRNNRLISASTLSLAFNPNLFWAGCSIFDGSRWLTGDSIINNVIGWNRVAGNFPMKGRADENDLRQMMQNQMPAGLNTYLLGPITTATEDSEYAYWQKKLIDSGIFIGVTSAVITKPTTPSDTVLLIEGTAASGTVQPIDKNGKAASYLLKSFTYSSSDTSIMKVVISPTDEKAFTVYAVKPGIGVGTIRFTSKNATVITKQFFIKIVAKEPEAVDATISFL